MIHQFAALKKCKQAAGYATAGVSNTAASKLLEASKGSKIANQYDDNGAHSTTSSHFVSETSTLTYSQEPWETFQGKITSLAFALFPEGKADDVHVERMKGGSSNRIAGITVTPAKRKVPPLRRTYNALRMAFGYTPPHTETKTSQYILRMPRWGKEHMERDMGALKFASRWGCCTVPDIVSYDTTDTNELGGPYVLQQRLLGKNLGTAFAQLNFEQRKDLTRKAVQLILNLQKAKAPSCGVISGFRVATHGTIFHANTIPIPPDSGEVDGPSLTPAKEQTILDFIEDTCSRWKTEEATYLDQPNAAWDDITSMATEMHRLCYITDYDTYLFTHMELYPRNNLVDLQANSVEITAVLDWDDALFVPSYVAYRAPFWLWEGERNVNEQDEYEALKELENAELKELKNIFESMVDEKYLKYAHDPVYVLLRRMFAV